MKKLLSILLVLVLCTSLMALTASAEGGYAMRISSHVLEEGTKEVNVTVDITANDGLGALTINPKYDASVLKLINGEDLDDDGNADCWTTELDWTAAEDTGAVFVNAKKGTKYTGNVATFKFEVLKEEATNVTVSVAAATNDEVEINFTVSGGSIKFLCNHDYAKTASTAGDCVTKGTETYTCSKCGDSYTEETKLGNHGTLVETTTPATCEADGKTVKTCSICNEVQETVVLKATGHDYDEGVITTAAKCEAKGVKTYTCKNDASHTKTEEVAALGHDYELTGTTASECGKPGVNTYTCKNDASHVKTEEVAALEHQWDEGKVTTKPTCTEKGVKTYTCERGCGETKTEEVAALGHTAADAVVENEVAPTCTEAGSYDEVVYCSVCEEKLSSKTVEVKALGHDWDEGTVTTAATCYADGVMTHACKNGCDETKTSAITERPAHTVTNWAHDDAVYCIGTCDVAECGAAVKEKHVVNEWTQNEDGEYVGTCATCKQADINKGDLIPAGDITPILVMGGVAVFSMLAAAAYVTCRKFAK